MTIQTKCPTCGLERAVDAHSHEPGEELMCEPCAASYISLLNEIEVRAADREADATPAVDGEAATPLMLTAADDSDPEGQPPSLETDTHDESDADGYALGVSLYRVPAAGVAACAVCLFSLLFLVGWFKPAGAAESASVVASASVAPAAEIKDAGDKVVPASASAPADVNLSPAASHTPLHTTEEPAAEAEMPADEIDEAELEKDELEAEESDEPESVSARAPEPARSVGEGGRFTVQVGSYNRAGEADGRASNIRAAGFEARVVAVEIPKKGTWYRVQSGRFQTREEATLYEKRLRASGAAAATFVSEIQN